MKTNVTMVSKDRELFGVIIKQDTKTSFNVLNRPSGSLYEEEG